jgi:uncharacterized membrane protein (DUF4010 family)
MLSTPTMYLRILFLVAAFMPLGAVRLLPPFLLFSILSGGYAWWLRRGEAGATATEPAPGVVVKEKNPLELNAALLFALMFVTVSLVTKYVLLYYKELGLKMLSFMVGASDIVPFIVSVLQGNLGIGPDQILQAIVIATASNNVMKTAYVFTFGHRQTARLTAMGMAGIVTLSFLYTALAF